MAWIEQLSLKRYTLLTESKMVLGAFGCAMNYGWNGPFNSTKFWNDFNRKTYHPPLLVASAYQGQLFSSSPLYPGLSLIFSYWCCREGLVKHNPNTIRKVVASFAVTFKEDANAVEDRLRKMVKGSGRLFDMPVYNDSLQVAGKDNSKVLWFCVFVTVWLSIRVILGTLRYPNFGVRVGGHAFLCLSLFFHVSFIFGNY